MFDLVDESDSEVFVGNPGSTVFADDGVVDAGATPDRSARLARNTRAAAKGTSRHALGGTIRLQRADLADGVRAELLGESGQS